MYSFEIGLRSKFSMGLLRFSPEQSHQRAKRIVVIVNNSFLERNYRVVGDGDSFRTNFRAAFRDVAVSDTVKILELPGSVDCIERMHLQRRGECKKARTDERIVLLVI